MAQRHPIPPFDQLTYHPISRWVRGTRGEDTIVDSRRALLVWEAGKRVPIYAFPADDVPFGSDDDGALLGVRSFDDPDLAGYLTIAWNSLDHWFEEDEEIFVHPRSPYTRVDALRATRRVTVELDGVVLAESSSPVLVFETGLPVRYYLNRTEIDEAHLVPSDTVTRCPYKGTTTAYWTAEVGNRREPDVAWSYDFPTRQLLPIAGLVAFYNERVDLVVDGRRLVRPRTHFS